MLRLILMAVSGYAAYRVAVGVAAENQTRQLLPAPSPANRLQVGARRRQATSR